jgi:hypothetical protein
MKNKTRRQAPRPDPLIRNIIGPDCSGDVSVIVGAGMMYPNGALMDAIVMPFGCSSSMRMSHIKVMVNYK